jgi:replicative DNA helicase
MANIEVLAEEVYISEAYLTGLFWGNPEIYSMYPQEKINKNAFGNTIWAFYFGLGRYMFDKGVSIFDDITVANAIKELNLKGTFEKFGEYETIDEIVGEVKDLTDNFEAYYDEVKKYSLLRSYHTLFGDKVIEKNGKYDYHRMNREMLQQYWSEKIEEASASNDTKNIEYDLLDDLESFIETLDVDADVGIDFYRSKRLTDSVNGWAYGTITILSAFSGNGKSSWTMEKIIMSCIQAKEKLLVVANEMDIQAYRKLLLITVMGSELHEKFDKSFSRQAMNKGHFTDEEKARLKMAVEWVRENTGENSNIIKFVPMENYTIENVEYTLRYYARRGYQRAIIDTAKPTESKGNVARWEQFVSDFERLYKIVRKDTGLGLALFATVQSADTALNMRFLNELCLADGKKIKNVADMVFHMRPAFQDEFEKGKHEVVITKTVPRSISQKDLNGYLDNGWFMDEKEKFDNFDENQKPYIEIKTTLKHGGVYYYMFTSKNRRGMSNLTGASVIVYRVDFNSNRWTEVGTTDSILRDTNM